MDGGDSVSNGDVSYRFTHDVKAGLSLRWAHMGFFVLLMHSFIILSYYMTDYYSIIFLYMSYLIYLFIYLFIYLQSLYKFELHENFVDRLV